jgi:hypothetical protein
MSLGALAAAGELEICVGAAAARLRFRTGSMMRRRAR